MRSRRLPRVAFLFNPRTAPFARYYLETFRSSAAALNIAPIESAVHTAVEVEAAMAELGREGSVGIIVIPETFTGGYGEAIISLPAAHDLPV
jgi:putative ABC transport system substrate-binding protein